MTVKVSGSSGLIFLDGILQSYGDSNDLQINHDGSNSYINDAGTGNLRLQTGGSTKLEITSSGIDVTGTVTADGLTVDGSGAKYLNIGSTDGSGAYIYLDGSSNGDFLGGDYSVIKNHNNDLVLISGTPNGDIDSFTHDGSGNKLRHKIGSNGDISFYEDTGTTAKFFWDASAEQLNIGGSSSEISDTSLNTQGSAGMAVQYAGNDGTYIRLRPAVADGTNFIESDARRGDYPDIAIKTSNTERMRIDSSGNVGIGTSSPASPSHTKGTSSTGFYGNVVSTFEDSSNNYPALAFKGTSGHLFGMRCEGGESMTFATTPSGTSWNPVMRMDADGLKFNGDTSSANALDDYEEGTWTPSIEGSSTAGTASYNDRIASYTKIGNLVNVSFYISGTFSSTPSGSVKISGLPFTSMSNTNGLGYPSTKGAIGHARSGYHQSLYVYVEQSQSNLWFGKTQDNGGLDGANFSTHLSNSNFQIHIGLTYKAS